MLRKNLLYVVVVLNMSGSLQAMFNSTKLSSIKRVRAYCSKLNTVKLPSAEEMKKRLYKNGFGHLVDSTQIDVELGDKELYPLDIVKAVEAYVYEYDKYLYLKTPMTKAVNQMYTQQLIAFVLQETPKEFAELFKQIEEANTPGSRE